MLEWTNVFCVMNVYVCASCMRKCNICRLCACVCVCVSECVIWNMCHPLYTWILADTPVGASVKAHTHTHTHRHILLHILAFDLDAGRAIKTFRWVTALRALNFDACWVSVDKLTCLFKLPSINELLLSDVSEEGPYFPAGRHMSSGYFISNFQLSSA